MVGNATARREIVLLGTMLLADAVFFFYLIPAGIFDPEGFGLAQGLPPSFTAKVVAILMAAIMVLRLFQLLTNPALAEDGEVDADGEVKTEMDIGVRNLAGIAVALLFAFILVPLIGYYLAGLVMVAALMAAMGETNPLSLAWQPATVIGMIWLLFDQIFSIRLPVGQLFGG